MKFDGKEPKECKSVKDLAEAVEGALDRFVLALQKRAYRDIKWSEDFREPCDERAHTLCVEHADTIMESLKGINKQFGTEYYASCEEIENYFDKSHPTNPGKREPFVL